jgi:transposase InsO family protein
MQEWSKLNKGFRYMLNVIDVFSKYAWSIPMKDKTGITTVNAFKEMVEASGRKPRHIWVDQGKEFYNKHMNEWLTENNINRYSTYGEHKSAVVEKFNCTLKANMWKWFTAENTRNWIDMLDKLMAKYNNTVHSTIKMTPVEARKPANKIRVLNDHGYWQHQQLEPKFEGGDRVRISRVKAVFEKGYLPNW